MLLLQPPADTEEIDRLPDDVFLLILSYVSTDIKSLVRCSVVSRRFHLLVSLVPSLLIHVNRTVTIRHKSLPLILRALVSKITLEPFRCVGFESSPTRHLPLSRYITYCIPIHSLKNFNNLRSLHIDLPYCETYVDRCTSSTSSSTLLHWHAHFGSSLHRCLILAAASSSLATSIDNEKTDVADYDSVPHEFYKMIAMVWATAALAAASSRHYWFQQTVKEHANIESLIVTDADGQGVFRMDRDQLKELRKGPVLVAAAPKMRTMVPANRMWEWFAPVVKLSCGQVLKGVTLIAVLASGAKGEDEELGWIKEEFDGMYAEAARVTLKRRSRHHHYVETESF